MVQKGRTEDVPEHDELMIFFGKCLPAHFLLYELLLAHSPQLIIPLTLCFRFFFRGDCFYYPLFSLCHLFSFLPFFCTHSTTRVNCGFYLCVFGTSGLLAYAQVQSATLFSFETEALLVITAIHQLYSRVQQPYGHITHLMSLFYFYLSFPTKSPTHKARRYW